VSVRVGPDLPVDPARARGFLAMQVTAIVEVNTPAVHLWQPLGFTITGTVPEACTAVHWRRCVLISPPGDVPAT
jgi:hypothetical protein